MLISVTILSKDADSRRCDPQDAAKSKGIDDVLEYCKSVKADAHSYSFEHWSLARRYISLKFKSFKKFHVRAVNDTRMAQLEMMPNMSHFTLMQFHLARAHERVSEMKKMVQRSRTKTLEHTPPQPYTHLHVPDTFTLVSLHMKPPFIFALSLSYIFFDEVDIERI